VATARESFFWDGTFYAAGVDVDDKAPVVGACPSLFDRSAPAAPVVEQATAAPGEKRTTARKAKA
jgi:hypothetical protein